MNARDESIEAAKAALLALVPVKKTKRDELVEMFLSQVGTTESDGNQVKYNFFLYGRNVKDGDRPGAKYPWCAAFISWCFAQIGRKLPRADYNNGFSSVPNLYQYAVNHNMFTENPAPGDIIIYQWGGKLAHVGFFVNWKDGRKSVYACEGNTSFDDAGSQDNGGAVAMKTRNAGLVKAFISSEKFLS